MFHLHTRRITFGLLVAVGLTACSSGSPSGGVPSANGSATNTPTTQLTSAQGDQLFVDYVHCVRARGVAIPDPVHRPGHQGLTLSIPDYGTPGFAAADAACKHYLAPVIAMKQAGRGQPSAATMTALIAYARCMRAHDIPLLDPAPTDGHISLGDVAGINNNVGRKDPLFQTADAACRHLLPRGVADDGTGPP